VNLNNGDAAIVALKAVNDAPVSDNIEPQMKQNITMAQAQKNYTVFIESLKQQAELNVPKAAQPAE
ncbi:MAG TPA: peptidylprolyl isomerase, partial [Pseudoalteromonas sp.]|nr:peptidylprolyl isomerase [Pseudoalteromonas sp.]